MSYLGDPTIVVIDWSPDGHGSVAPFVPAMYRLLEDHWFNDQLYLAGTIVSVPAFGFVPTGPLAPVNWIPSPNVEPLNSRAASAFYAAGPRDLGLVRQQWQDIGIAQPVTYWKQTHPNVWVLTGLGVNFAPVIPSIPVPHPVGNTPQ